MLASGSRRLGTVILHLKGSRLARTLTNVGPISKLVDSCVDNKPIVDTRCRDFFGCVVVMGGRFAECLRSVSLFDPGDSWG